MQTHLCFLVFTVLFSLDAAFAENLMVTCGSTIKLLHINTKIRLHSHEVSYARGSQQQSVTGFPSGDDGNSYWIVKGIPDDPCTPGSLIKKGQKVRIQHNPTRRWLHSHLYYSPLTNSQEVSCFGGEEESDTGDHWVVDWDSKGKYWKQDTKVRLKHVDTGKYLYSHDVKFGNPIAGQQEIVAMDKKDKNAEWHAAEGVYYPQPSDDKKDEL